MKFWIEFAGVTTPKYDDNSSGLKALCTSGIRAGDGIIHLDLSSLDVEEQINFIALLQKCWKHAAFVLGIRHSFTGRRPKIWQRYRRNIADTDHEAGVALDQLIQRYLAENLPHVTYATPGVFSFKADFLSAEGAAAVVGRLANMARWCKQHTSLIRLMTETLMTWKTFNEISLNTAQPVIRRRARR